MRAAVQALAAALGGVQSMALSCFDEAIAIPTQRAQTLAVRTQQMLQHEFGITDVADPLGGSWYVEQLTDRLEADARALMDEIERLGGAVAAIEQGYYQQLIAEEAYRKHQRIADGEDIVVGVNAFRDEDGAQRRSASTCRSSWSRRSASCWPRCGAGAIRRRWTRRWQRWPRPRPATAT